MGNLHLVPDGNGGFRATQDNGCALFLLLAIGLVILLILPGLLMMTYLHSTSQDEKSKQISSMCDQQWQSKSDESKKGEFDQYIQEHPHALEYSSELTIKKQLKDGFIQECTKQASR